MKHYLLHVAVFVFLLPGSPPLASAQSYSVIDCDLLSPRAQCTRQTEAVPDPVRTQDISPRPLVLTYSNGQLTVVAHGAPLSEVLHAISTETGTSVEFPEGTATDRTFVNLGPAPERNVLASLLNGSGFNYIMVGDGINKPLDRLVLTQPSTLPTSPNSAPVQASTPAESGPELYGNTFSADPAPAAGDGDSSALQAPEVSPEEKKREEMLDAMQKERLRARQEQQQQQ